MELIDQHVESLIFTSGQPISEKDITASLHKAIDEAITKEDIDASLERLVEKYKSEEYAFEIVPISRGYHFMTKGAYHNTVGEHLKIISKKKLSRAALETLAIIAYKQPVTRIDLEAIRGVGCDYTIQKLMEKELVEMQGRSPGPGRPLLYGTSEKFMDYFGIKDLKDLPKPKDFEMPETEVGEPAPIEVVVPNESTEGVNDEAILPDGEMGDSEIIATEEILKEESKEIAPPKQLESVTEELENISKEEIEVVETEEVTGQTGEVENLTIEEEIVEAEKAEYPDQLEADSYKGIQDQVVEQEINSNEEIEDVDTTQIESAELVEYVPDDMLSQNQDSNQQEALTIIKNYSSEEEE